MREFVHLHNHTHYSLLDSITTPGELLNAAIEDKQRAIALTDHGVMFGCFELYKAAKGTDCMPIMGCEVYITNGNRFEKAKNPNERNYYHLVLLAKGKEGYNNLAKLSSYGHTEGFYYRPRIDKELLEKYKGGLIALSACIGGVVNAHLIDNNYSRAKQEAAYYKEVFGEDFYIELQNHHLPQDKIILTEAPRIARELDLKTVATNDIHYLRKEHAKAHNIHLLIRKVSASNAGTFDIDKYIYGTPEYYFKTQQEMNELFADFPEALDSTVEIAEKCHTEIDTTLQMPRFDIPEDSNAKNLDEFLIELTYKGLEEKYPEITEDIRKRAEYELGVIIDMKFPGYFLIVQDFIQQGRKMGVRVGPGRGSAAGSLVAYALGITNVDPLPYDLLFERFLNPERVNMPDIDIDFADDKRDMVINYVKEKYGEMAVSMIITFGKLSTKAVLKDVGRVLGIPHTEINQINARIPVNQGKVTPLAKALELEELRDVKENPDPKMKLLLENAKILEGKYRNNSTHAAGVVIAPSDICNFVPVFKSAKTKDQSVEIVSQYSMADIEDAGLLKMDFLGLRTLSIIENSLLMIEENHGKYIDMDAIDYDDKETYDMLSEGKTQGIFQFESQGMQEYLKQLKPHNLEELTAMNALYRPGPMENIPDFIDRKFGRKPIEYLDPIMEPTLKNTYGIIVYQEQVMQLARDVGGFTLGGADLLRRAMGKKKIKVMEAQRPLFVEGAAKHGISEKTALEIFSLIEKFAKYGFNKSHSLAYSYLAFQTAWLKTHYTAEFLAANMTAELNDQAKIVALMEEANKFDIEVLPPDVNKSFAQFTAHGKEILFGLAAIRNVGIHAVDSIIEARNEKPFESFFDFVARVDTRQINKRVLESLTYAGALRAFESKGRAALFNSIEPALDFAKAYQDNQSSQMDSLFGNSTTVDLKEPQMPEAKEWPEKIKLDHEKEVLNFYVSGSHMDRYKVYIDSFTTFRLDQPDTERMGQKVRICGILDQLRTTQDRNGHAIAFAMLETDKGSAELLMWKETYKKVSAYLQNDSVVVVTGKIEMNDDKLKLTVDDMLPIETAVGKYANSYYIVLDLQKNGPAKIDDLAGKCTDLESKSNVCFHLLDQEKSFNKRYLAYDINLGLNYETVEEVSRIFGRDNVYLRHI